MTWKQPVAKLKKKKRRNDFLRFYFYNIRVVTIIYFEITIFIVCIKFVNKVCGSPYETYWKTISFKHKFEKSVFWNANLLNSNIVKGNNITFFISKL